VYLAASNKCFPELTFEAALPKLVDLEYTRIEIPFHEADYGIRPSDVAQDPERAITACRQTQRLTPIAFDIQINATGNDHYSQFSAICAVAKATKVITLIVRSGDLGTPFNAEVEHLQQLVDIASTDGMVVAIRTEAGKISEDPDTVKVLCDHIKGLAVALDPSHFYFGEMAGRSYEPIIPYTQHVYLRDTNKDNMQVRVGQGDVEYGRLISLLAQNKYSRALTVDMQPMPDVDQMAELRKIRLLIESLL
tara:strand:+ start:1875 stop:2624 length:750 start_codon:yes stop_codon:yes gene_type:complete